MPGPDEWLETVRQCQPLPELEIKKLCEMVLAASIYPPCTLHSLRLSGGIRSMSDAFFNFYHFICPFSAGEGTLDGRIKHPARAVTRHRLWRYPRTVL